MLEYIPKKLGSPELSKVESLWGNMHTLVEDIISTFNVNTGLALEFGVYRGGSISILAQYFKQVIGIDPFDRWQKEETEFLEILRSLNNFKNIQLIERTFQDYIKLPVFDHYDLIHIDIGYTVHDYETTYPCGEWSVQHADCVLFHDTESFPEVKRACIDLANEFDREFYNYPFDSGLGIIVKK
jgi:hypothetical protein